MSTPTKKFYKCEHCGNIFGVVNDANVVPFCCGTKMTILEANTTDAAQEKHVPVIERNGKNIIVRVGSVPHPMLDEHYIQWVAVMQGDKTERIELKPGDEPIATFVVDSDTEAIRAYEYCNLHGLWTAEG